MKTISAQIFLQRCLHNFIDTDKKLSVHTAQKYVTLQCNDYIIGSDGRYIFLRSIFLHSIIYIDNHIRSTSLHIFTSFYLTCNLRISGGMAVPRQVECHGNCRVIFSRDISVYFGTSVFQRWDTTEG